MQGIFPHELKLAKVIPIHEGGCDFSPNNYRPLSLLSPLAKVFESLIFEKMLKFIAENKILSKEQIEFRELHSTNHVLSDIFSPINNNRVNQHFTIDLKKAFDTVDHQILLSKLEKLGFNGNFYNLFEDYLNDRKQYVNVNNNVSSHLLKMLTGVPQGSILDPTLFSLCVNHLPSASDFETRRFADDTVLIMNDVGRCLALNQK